VVILKVDKANKKISLGYKQVLANPWDELKSRHPEGSVVEGVVKNVADFGVFVDIGEVDRRPGARLRPFLEH
jgi:small subunit ribosomal protein S1